MCQAGPISRLPRVAAMWIDEFVDCFDKNDSSLLEIDKAFLIKEQHIPNRLYKFRCVDDHSMNNLTNDTIWLSSPSKYNDPFDCAATLSVKELFASAVKSRLDDIPVQDGIPGLDELYKLIPDDKINELRQSANPFREIISLVLESHESINHKIPETLDNLEDTTYNLIGKSYLEIINHCKDGIKLCSFSATMKPITIWSHYANHHKGFCIEYDIETLSPGDMRRRMLFPVIYSNSMFDCTRFLASALTDLSKINNIYTQLQAIYKSYEWSYEMEWRLVFIGGLIRAECCYPMPTPSKIFL
jgi:hypothetical protein